MLQNSDYKTLMTLYADNFVGAFDSIINRKFPDAKREMRDDKMEVRYSIQEGGDVHVLANETRLGYTIKRYNKIIDSGFFHINQLDCEKFNLFSKKLDSLYFLISPGVGSITLFTPSINTKTLEDIVLTPCQQQLHDVITQAIESALHPVSSVMLLESTLKFSFMRKQFGTLEVKIHENGDFSFYENGKYKEATPPSMLLTSLQQLPVWKYI